MIIPNKLTKEPKISIIITFYNLGKYINDCVFSILGQTYENYEIIIVNDGSNQENSKILNRIKHEKIKILNLPKNEGQLSAFCEGLRNAQGEFICMVDADDILLPNYLKTLLYIHLTNNIALVSSSCGEINEKSEIVSLNSITNQKYSHNNKVNYIEVENSFQLKNEFTIKKIKAPFGYWTWNPSTSAMFRKSSLDILKYFPNKNFWKIGADKVIFSLLHLIGGSCNISAICFLYRHHGNNGTETTLSTGNKKYLNENFVHRLIEWNMRLRIDTYKMFQEHKYEFIKKYNKINYYKMLFKIIFCIDYKICVKITKAILHKIIK